MPDLKAELIKQGIAVKLGNNHGLVFCSPNYNVIQLFPCFHDSIEKAYNYYKPYFKT